MATTGLSYSELSEDAKEVALNSFINFYVDQYHRGSLEILSSQVSNELMATINQILCDNAFMGHQELVNVSTRLSKPAYQKILTALTNVKFHEETGCWLDEGLGTKRGTVTRRRLGKQLVGFKKEGGVKINTFSHLLF